MSKGNGVVKQIFKDHFKEFWKNKQNKFPDQMREHLFKEVIKIINCGEFALSFVSYICMICLEKIKLGFSCKSRFCKMNQINPCGVRRRNTSQGC